MPARDVAFSTFLLDCQWAGQSTTAAFQLHGEGIAPFTVRFKMEKVQKVETSTLTLQSASVGVIAQQSVYAIVFAAQPDVFRLDEKYLAIPM